MFRRNNFLAENSRSKSTGKGELIGEGFSWEWIFSDTLVASTLYYLALEENVVLSKRYF
jgi:hypothetical protein